MSNATNDELNAKLIELENDKRLLQKELAVKNVISEISRFQSKDDDIDMIYKRIFTLLSEIVRIENFYICFVQDNNICIPFIVDEQDDIPESVRNEKTNPELRYSLTAYALKQGKALTLTEKDVLKLQQEGKFKALGKLPKQWVFIPYYSPSIEGGIVAQSYSRTESYSYSDMSILTYVTMHIGNFLSAYNSKQKIKQQFEELKAAQSQLVHSEKMASVGQLAAGVAHEINNPLGYVNSNLNSLKEYVKDLGIFIRELEAGIIEQAEETSVKLLSSLKEKHDIEFILTDTDELVSESIFGMDKVKKIIQSLKNFTHAGEEMKQLTDINQCIDETIRIVWNEIKYHCEIDKQFGEVPEIYCYPSQLNQVFMNLMINAGHAIKENGLIKVSTEADEDWITIRFQDNGSGIDKKNLSQLFNPFFTTKPVGEGTGLGLSISYGIIENHQGTIQVESEVGAGTCFIIKLPIITELEDEELEDQAN
ncbi:sensor histidine kinase [Aliikangiella sp. IMCC44653]